MRIVYKVVRRVGNYRYSAVQWSARNWRVCYAPQHVARRTGTKLFAFATRQAALDFAGPYSRMVPKEVEVWKAEAMGIEHCFSAAFAYNTTDMCRFWQGKLTQRWTEPTPPGTVLCDSIRLTEQVL